MSSMTTPSTAPTWTNWDGRQHAAPAVLERPATIAALRTALERAHDAGHRVRVAGSGHSFTALVPTDGTLISLQRHNRLLDADRASGLVRVQAGISIGTLNAALDGHGLALENLGDIDVQSIAGATATGTHGTGARLGNLSVPVRAVQLMRADGTLVELDAQSDPDGWRAARVNLGALGVVTELTIQAVPAFTLRGIDGPMELEEVLDRIDELAAAHDHFEFYWFPFTTRVLVRRNDRTDDPPAPRSALRAWVQDILLVNHALQGISMLGRRVPALIPALNRTATAVAGSSERTDVSHRIFTSPRQVRFTEMEYAIPRARAAEAIRAIRDGIAARGLLISFPIEVRVVAGDDALLSPAHGRDTCYIAVHVFDGTEYEPYFRMVEEIMDGFGGRPHWGKRHFQTAATLAPRYPQWDRFQAVRARLDPDGRFANDELERVLGPVAIPVQA
jgi:FAD-linked oxidoreductase